MRKYGENVTVSLTGISTSAELGRKKGSYMVRPVLQEKIHMWHKEIMRPYIRPYDEVLNDFRP